MQNIDTMKEGINGKRKSITISEQTHNRMSQALIDYMKQENKIKTYEELINSLLDKQISKTT